MATASAVLSRLPSGPAAVVRPRQAASGPRRALTLVIKASAGSEAGPARWFSGLALASAAAAVVAVGGGPLVPSAVAIPQTSACATEPCDGKDYSNQDLRAEFYTKGSLKNANFKNSDLSGVTLFGANLFQANLENANLENSNLGTCNLTGANLKNARLEGAIVSSATLEKLQLDGSDWTDVILRKDINDNLCKYASGTNPVTGVDTRESLMCRD